jgi:hypothetical protein
MIRPSSSEKLAWQAIVYSDLIEKSALANQTYEKIKGKTDRVFEDAMQAGIAAIEAGGGLQLIKAAKKAARAFSASNEQMSRKPLIGIVGDIFVRTTKKVINSLCALSKILAAKPLRAQSPNGLNTLPIRIEESTEASVRQKSLGNIGEAAKFWLTAKYQRLVARFIAQPFNSLLKNRFDHHTEHILEETAEIFSNHINGGSHSKHRWRAGLCQRRL